MSEDRNPAGEEGGGLAVSQAYLSEVDEKELRGQPKTARSRTVKAESVMLRSWSQQTMDHFRCSLAQLPTTHQEPRQVHKRGSRDPGHETVPNTGKTTNHLQAKGNEATNSLQQENLLRSNSKGERQRQSPQS